MSLTKTISRRHTNINHGIRLIGLSGKKQSGKNTVCEDIKKFVEETKGKDKFVKVYSFADSLKEHICIGMMNLSREQCFGTDEDKNTLTEYTWSRLPKEISSKYGHNGDPKEGYADDYMSAREIMQVVGTDIFRKFFGPYIHINATFNKINQDNPYLAIISDVRFQVEVLAICANAGFSIRLLRNFFSSDKHESEIALDHMTEKDWRMYNGFVIDNSNMNIEEQAASVISIVKDIKFFCDLNEEDMYVKHGDSGS